VSPPSGRDDEADPGFDFPARSGADEDLFRDAAPAPARTARGLVTGVVVVLVVLGIVAGTRMLGGGSHARPEPAAEPASASQSAPPAPAAPAAGEAPPATDAAPEAPATPVAAPSPVPPVAPAAAEPPKPVAEPSKPAPTRDAAAASSSTKSARTTSSAPPQRLLSEGWKAVEKGDFEAARDRFSLALQGKASAGALYGRGYANEKLGRTAEAGADYCRALTLDADLELSREIQSGLRRIGHSC
jgi:type IV secretory pathway VirB10-like protein